MDEVTNVGSNAQKEHKKAEGDQPKIDYGMHRFLKLFLTDGKQQVVGLELTKINSLDSQLPAGTKVGSERAWLCLACYRMKRTE